MIATNAVVSISNEILEGLWLLRSCVISDFQNNLLLPLCLEYTRGVYMFFIKNGGV